MIEKPPVNDKSKSVTLSEKHSSCLSILAASKDDDGEPYEPWKNRNLTHYLGTAGALFHMVKGSLGTGILAMPVSFKNGGLWTSLFCAIFVGAVYTHCIHILVVLGLPNRIIRQVQQVVSIVATRGSILQLSERREFNNGKKASSTKVYSCQVLCKRIRRPRLGYSEIAEAAFHTGPNKLRPYTSLAKQMVDTGLFLDYYMGCIVFVVFIASSIKQVLEFNFDSVLDIRLYILLVTLGLIPLGLIRNLKYLVPFSFIAILTLTFGCGFVLYDVFEDLPPIDSRPAFTSFERLPLFFATIIFAMDGIGTVLPIENAMKSPQHMLGCPGVLNLSMVWLVGLYCTMGFFGYLRYGDNTKGSVTLNITSSAMGQVVKLMVTINVICSYGLYLYVPVEILWRKLEHRVSEENKTRHNYFVRIGLMLLGGLLAATVPDLELFVGLVGAVCSSTVILFFPPVIELVTFWQDHAHWGRFRWRLFKNGLIILLWAITLVTGTSDSIRDVIKLYEKSSS